MVVTDEDIAKALLKRDERIEELEGLVQGTSRELTQVQQELAGTQAQLNYAQRQIRRLEGELNYDWSPREWFEFYERMEEEDADGAP